MVRRLAHRRLAIVAAGAGTQHRTMVHPRDLAERRGRMTVLAGIGRADMGRVLAGRRTAVMAGRTGPGHAAVIKGRATPAAGRVTVITAVTRLDMVRRLAHRRLAVVAAGAGAKDRAVIHSEDMRETVTGVTVGAFIARVNVSGRLCGRAHTRLCMTLGTSAGRSPEDTIGVTATAIQACMTTLKGKPRHKMVKVFTG